MNGLPGGAVTFLFTDIEGSTRLVKALRERYPQILADHRRLIRAAMPPMMVMRWTPKGMRFCGVRRGQAGGAVRGGDPAGAGRPWLAADGRVPGTDRRPHGARGPVGGDVHRAGEARRAARICAAACGGEVLVSQATQSIIADEEENDPGLPC